MKDGEAEAKIQIGQAFPQNWTSGFSIERCFGWAEGPSHILGPGFQPWNNCFLSAWRVAPS
jgi:hypothetical protein